MRAETEQHQNGGATMLPKNAAIVARPVRKCDCPAGNGPNLIIAFLTVALLILSLQLAALAAGPLPQGQPASVSGSWEVTWIRFGQTNVDRIQLQQAGDKISGNGFGLTLDGTFKDSKLELNVVGEDKKAVASFTGTLRGTELSGVMKIDTSEFTWTARRTPSRPETPRLHNFEAK